MRVLIIDDDKLVCSSLKTIIEAKGVEVVAVGYNGEEAIALYEQHRPDVLMMDIRMEVMNGVDASEKILQK
ncbi:MAG: response regulator, partial [Longicatena sp.]